MVDIQSATAEIRRGKKKRKNNKLQDENINNVRICYAGWPTDHNDIICIAPWSPRMQQRSLQDVWPSPGRHPTNLQLLRIGEEKRRKKERKDKNHSCKV